MSGDLHDRLGTLALRAPSTPVDLDLVRALARRRRSRRRLAVAAPLLALLAAAPLAVVALDPGRGGDRLVEQPAVRTTGPDAQRLCDDAAARYDGVVVSAEPTTVGAVRADPATGRTLPAEWSAASPDDPAARCTVDGAFPVPAPPGTGTPPATRGVLLVTEGAPPLLLGAGSTAAPSVPGTAPSSAPTRTVTLSFVDSTVETDCSQVVTVQRDVPETEQVLTAALRELFRGPTDEEAARGASGFGPETADLLRSARVLDGIAYLDLDAAVLPGTYSTSCGSAAFLAMVRGTATQFSTVRDVRAALDGDPAAFVAFLEGACPQPATSGDVCDPSPYR